VWGVLGSAEGGGLDLCGMVDVGGWLCLMVVPSRCPSNKTSMKREEGDLPIEINIGKYLVTYYLPRYLPGYLGIGLSKIRAAVVPVPANFVWSGIDHSCRQIVIYKSFLREMTITELPRYLVRRAQASL
jgi:hypothetical protein